MPERRMADSSCRMPLRWARARAGRSLSSLDSEDTATGTLLDGWDGRLHATCMVWHMVLSIHLWLCSSDLPAHPTCHRCPSSDATTHDKQKNTSTHRSWVQSHSMKPAMMGCTA